MRKLSDFELKRIMQAKLYSLEADVPVDSDDEIFAALGESRKSLGLGKKIAYISAAALVFLWITISVVIEKRESQPTLLKKTSSAFKTTPKIKSPAPYTSDKHNEGKIKFNSTKKIAGENDSQPADVVVRNNDEGIIPGTLQVAQIEGDEEIIAVSDTLKVAVAAASDFLEENHLRPKNKMWLTAGLMPFQNYNQFTPLANDGFLLSRFEVPGTISLKRAGIQLSMVGELEISSRKIIFVGVHYVRTNVNFKYASNETGQMILADNVVEQTQQTVGVSVGFRQPLKLEGSRRQYISGGIVFQKKISSYVMIAKPLEAMLNVSYSYAWTVGKGFLRTSPSFYYSLTKENFPGVQSQPYRLGIECSYSLPLKLNL
jgi:hypothetical protein